jgi:peptidoglycan/LPS O-acetylase OafA/YrhL
MMRKMSKQITLQKSEAGSLIEFSKGAAILLIFFHHFARSAWLARGLPTPALLQWEFTAQGHDVGLLASALQANRYSELLLRILAQYGYVGVHLFVLMSGLGLALGTAEDVSFGAFLSRRTFKLVPPFWLAVAAFSLTAWATRHAYSIGQICERLFLLTSFDEKNFFIIDSPLWCLAVFFQLYLLFLPLRRLILRWGILSIILLTMIAYLARLATELPRISAWNKYFGHTFALNWIAVFGLGIWVGNKLRGQGVLWLPVWTIVAAQLATIPLLALSELSHVFYPIHDTVLGIFMGSALLLTWTTAQAGHAEGLLCATGSVSFPLYLYHRPIVAWMVQLWMKRCGSNALPPVTLGAAVAILLIVLLMLTRKGLHRSPRIAAWMMGG